MLALSSSRKYAITRQLAVILGSGAPLIAWMALGLLARVITLRRAGGVSLDGQRYLIYAANIGHGDLFHPAAHWAPYPPLYPALIWLTSLSGLTFTHAAYAVSLIAGLLLIAVLFTLVQQTLGSTVAHMTAALTALSGLLSVYSTAVMSEATYYLLVALVLLIIIPPLYDQRPVPRWGLIALPILAIAIASTRYIGIVVFPALLLTALIVQRWRVSRTLTIMLTISFIVGGMTVVGISTAIQHRMTQVTGQLAENYATGELINALNDGTVYSASELRQMHSPGPAESPLVFLRDNARLVIERAVLLTRNDLESGVDTVGIAWNDAPVVPAYLLVLCLIGAIPIWNRDYRHILILTVPIALLALPNAIFVRDPRYYVILLLPILPLAAMGVVHVVRARNSPRALRWSFLVLCLVLYVSDLHYVHTH